MMVFLEDNIQKSIVQVVRLQYPKSIIYACPNGGKRNLREAGRLKAQGVLAGVADLTLIHKGMLHFFEVKIPKGKQSDNQKEFQRLVEEQGFKYFIVTSAEETLNIIKTL